MIDDFKPQHLYQIDMRPQERERLNADPQGYDKVINVAMAGMTGTIWHKGMILGIIGFVELYPKHLEIYAFPSIHVPRYPMVYLRYAKRYLRAIERDFKPVRIQSTSFADPLHTRWMEWLGFENETPNGMRCHSVLNQTFNMWSRILEENI